jgi:acyl transferase domain-containing protein
VNQSGMAHSITHPHGPTQESLFKRVLERSDLDPHLVNFVEAHGTGTQAGDVNEIQSLRRILAVDRSSNNPLYIGAIKGNIGHLEAASGSASLAKVLLMLRHKMIPAQVSFKQLNPKIPCLDIDNTVISTENIPWLPPPGVKRRFALINNFGAAGSNAAMIIEEYVPASTKPPRAMFLPMYLHFLQKTMQHLKTCGQISFAGCKGTKKRVLRTCLTPSWPGNKSTRTALSLLLPPRRS